MRKCSSMSLISLPEGARILGVTYNVFYQRLHNPTFNYPKVIYAKNVPMVRKEDCEECARQEKEFKANHISVKEASKKIFGDAHTLSAIRYYRPYSFLPLIVNRNKPYLNRKDFEDFYERYCSGRKLIRLRKIINVTGLGNTVLFYYFLRNTGFYEKVRTFVFCKNGRKYYNLVDVNNWLKENHLPQIDK